MSENCVFGPCGQFSDIFRTIFSTFFRHFVDIPVFWAVQRFARYKERVCSRERAVLRQTSAQDFFSEKGRSETDPLGRVISESCIRSLEPRSRSQKMPSIAGKRRNFFMRCDKGIFAKGFWDVRGFPFCRGKKGLRLPLAVGKRVWDSLVP